MGFRPSTIRALVSDGFGPRHRRSWQTEPLFLRTNSSQAGRALWGTFVDVSTTRSKLIK